MLKIKQENGQEEPTTKRRAPRRLSGGKYCCVVGCHRNSLAHRGQVRFFSFPKRNPEQVALWLKAINRKNPDGSPWDRIFTATICGDHFVGDKPSCTRHDVNYAPTLFPDPKGEAYKKHSKLSTVLNKPKPKKKAKLNKVKQETIDLEEVNDEGDDDTGILCPQVQLTVEEVKKALKRDKNVAAGPSSKRESKRCCFPFLVTSQDPFWSLLPLEQRHRMLHNSSIYASLLSSVCYMPKCPWTRVLCQKGVRIPLHGHVLDHFVENPQLADQWRGVLDNPDLTQEQLAKIRVCEIHFADTDFINATFHGSSVKVLTSQVVPCRYLAWRSENLLDHEYSLESDLALFEKKNKESSLSFSQEESKLVQKVVQTIHKISDDDDEEENELLTTPEQLEEIEYNAMVQMLDAANDELEASNAVDDEEAMGILENPRIKKMIEKKKKKGGKNNVGIVVRKVSKNNASNTSNATNNARNIWTMDRLMQSQRKGKEAPVAVERPQDMVSLALLKEQTKCVEQLKSQVIQTKDEVLGMQKTLTKLMAQARSYERCPIKYCLSKYTNSFPSVAKLTEMCERESNELTCEVSELKCFKKKGLSNDFSVKKRKRLAKERHARRRAYLRREIERGNLYPFEICHVFSQTKLPCDTGHVRVTAPLKKRTPGTAFDPFKQKMVRYKLKNSESTVCDDDDDDDDDDSPEPPPPPRKRKAVNSKQAHGSKAQGNKVKLKIKPKPARKRKREEELEENLHAQAARGVAAMSNMPKVEYSLDQPLAGPSSSHFQQQQALGATIEFTYEGMGYGYRPPETYNSQWPNEYY